MTLIVGCPLDGAVAGAAQLGAMLARSSGEDLVAPVVVPDPWTQGKARVDAEYRSFLDARADEALDAARAALPTDVAVTLVKHHARSAPTGLLEVAARHDARMIVLGSSSSGRLGRVTLGGVSDHLLHSSPRLIALAPRGFRCAAPRVTRVTAAFGGEPTDNLVLGAAGEAARVEASLRLTSFAVRPRSTISAGVGSRAETAVVTEWMRSMQEEATETIAKVSRLPQPPTLGPTVIGRGATWDAALHDIPWTDGDVLVVGSSSHGPLAQVFLGSRASKFVRHSPVPVVVVPRRRRSALRSQVRRG